MLSVKLIIAMNCQIPLSIFIQKKLNLKQNINAYMLAFWTFVSLFQTVSLYINSVIRDKFLFFIVKMSHRSNNMPIFIFYGLFYSKVLRIGTCTLFFYFLVSLEIILTTEPYSPWRVGDIVLRQIVLFVVGASAILKLIKFLKKISIQKVMSVCLHLL